MNRPKWTPQTDEDRAELARLEVLAEQVEKAKDALLEHAILLVRRRFPGEEVARRSGISKATIYRKIKDRGHATNG